VKKKTWGLLICLLLVFPLGTRAADYPIKPINVILGYAAGGSTDAGARFLASAATKIIPQPLVIVNKPGASGQIGLSAVAQAKADGYTIGFVNCPTAVLVALEKNATYKMKDFRYIINIMEDIPCLCVRTESPFKTVEDLVKYAKEKPSELTIGNAGFGTDSHITSMEIAKKANMLIMPVSFKGGSEARIAVLSGYIDAALLKVGEVKSSVESKQFRVLAVAAGDRAKDFPDVPTLKERGINTTMTVTRGIVGPVSMSESVVRYLHDQLKKVIDDPEFIKQAEKTGTYVKYISPTDYKKYLTEIEETYGPIWREINKRF
jgi:tripartite-type tricarboxylate transporter receptor subunit TctC